MISSDWLLRYAARLDVIALRLAYAGNPREDRPDASWRYLKPDYTIGFRVMLPADVPAFIEDQWGEGYSAGEVAANRSCDCRRVEMAVD